MTNLAGIVFPGFAPIRCTFESSVLLTGKPVVAMGLVDPPLLRDRTASSGADRSPPIGEGAPQAWLIGANGRAQSLS